MVSGGKMAAAAPGVMDTSRPLLGRRRGSTDICPFYNKVTALPESSGQILLYVILDRTELNYHTGQQGAWKTPP